MEGCVWFFIRRRDDNFWVFGVFMHEMEAEKRAADEINHSLITM